MPIDLSISASDGQALMPNSTREALERLFPELSFSESEDGAMKLRQMEAIGAKIPEVIRENFEKMTPRYQATFEADESSFYIEFPSNQEFEYILVEIRGPNPFNEIIGRLIACPDWILRGPTGRTITSLT